MLNLVKKFWNDEQGLETVEYAVAAALVVAGLIAAFAALGNSVEGKIEALTGAIDTTDAGGAGDGG